MSAMRDGDLTHTVKHFLSDKIFCKAWFSRRILSYLLVVAGVCLLSYVGYSYFVMYHEQQRLAREWEQQQKAIQPNLATDSAALAALHDDGLTRVSIPRISLDVIIVEGTSHKQLALGPGHVKNTPVPGDLGNSVISAHRDTFFRHIYELNKGDEIVVKRRGRTFTYQVTGKKIVDPNDTSVLAQSKDARLTLITCYPIYYIGPAPKRLVVISKLVEPVPESTQKAQNDLAVHHATP